ncbi:hypothetical protein EV127DRAFT_423948 [Xylaria flabelliformis]|nr:hypothetical protein EV127DRAFT_423948 [Xylaria flabelliformis]
MTLLRALRGIYTTRGKRVPRCRKIPIRLAARRLVRIYVLLFPSPPPTGMVNICFLFVPLSFGWWRSRRYAKLVVLYVYTCIDVVGVILRPG